ncbi:MAG: sulfotransferase [Cyclobacteriaceae bacterium]|nr:sulfotransferase [Cyclobacteriaceae bacterium]
MQIKYKFNNYLSIFKHTVLGINFSTWVKLLVKHHFAIGFPFLLKGLSITLISFFNIPFQLFEHLYYHKKIKATKLKPPIFILGHPRSGTTYLHYVLSKDSQFAYCSTNDALTPHVMLTASNITEKILDKFMPATRPQDNVKAGAKLPKEEEFAMGNICLNSFVHGFYFPKYFKKIVDENVLFKSNNKKSKQQWKTNFHYFIQKLTLKNNGKQLLLKSPANTGRLKEILELYPNAKFIHIHRNPYDVYQSNVGLYEKILPILSFHKVSNQFMEDFILYSYKAIHEKFIVDKNEIDKNQLFEISYDDFISNPEEQLRKAYLHLKLDKFENAQPNIREEIKSIKNYQPNTHSRLSEKATKAINEKWKFVFEEYGYPIISL